MITRAEAKTYLQISESTYDSLIDNYILYVTTEIENYLNNIIVERTITSDTLDTWDQSKIYALKGFPVRAFSLVDSESALPLTLDSDYFLNPTQGVLRFGTFPYKSYGRYFVTYTVGYAIEDVPSDLKYVALEAVKRMFEGNTPAKQGGHVVVESKKVGDFSVTYGKGASRTMIMHSIFEDFRYTLSNYMRVLI